MEGGVAQIEQEGFPEDHPQYNQTAEKFGDVFRSLIPGFDWDEFEDESLTVDWLCAVEQIMFDLYGVGDQEKLAQWNALLGHESRHPYEDAVIQAQRITTDLLLQLTEKSIPPRFRATEGGAAFSVKGTYTPDETQLLRQRQMDDLLHLSKVSRSFSVHPKYEGIFGPDGKLDMNKARVFVAEKAWPLEAKAIHLLKLSEFEQLQCRTLASKKINDKWRNSITHAGKVKAKLNAIAEKGRAVSPIRRGLHAAIPSSLSVQTVGMQRPCP